MASKIKYRLEFSLSFLVWASAVITFSVLAFIVIYILSKGILHITPSLFSINYNSTNVSLLPSFITTGVMILLSLVLAAPVGIFAAIYMVEYAKKNNKFVGILRITVETLSGIPSIVYGLFGLLYFVGYLKWGFSILSGSVTLAIMILPLIMRSTEEALRTVPDSFREGSFALGAGKLRTILRIILPDSIGGIFAGVILAVGRIIGETAALIYTAGTVVQLPSDIFVSARTLSVHMYILSSEGFYTDQAYATAVVLLVLVVLINVLSVFIAKKLAKER